MAKRTKASVTNGNGVIRIAAVGDLHVEEGAQTSYRELFGEVSRAADILVLAGDLTNLGKPAKPSFSPRTCVPARFRLSACSATTITNPVPSMRSRLRYARRECICSMGRRWS
jgi:3',5'-cyclic AMP phosphodiesterase CpdA